MDEWEYNRKFSKLESYSPYPFQEKLHSAIGFQTDELATIRGLMCANQIGKGLSLDEPVITPKGEILAGEIRVGDLLLDSQGQETKVLGVYPNQNVQLYRITFDNGTSVTTDSEHRWKCIKPTNRWKNRHSGGKLEPTPRYREFDVLTTQEIVERWGLDPVPRNRVAIPACEPAQHTEKDLPIDPYTLGAFLGDGSLLGTPIMTSADEYIADRCASGSDINVFNFRHSNRPQTEMYGTRGLRVEFAKLGLWGTRSHTKFIPQEYLYGSVEQRISLLQGLMDTDGTVSKVNGCIEFSSVSEDLADGVRQLFHSFGMKAKKFKRQTSYTYKGEKKLGQPSYRIRPRWNGIRVFGLDRKHERCFIPKSTCSDFIIHKIEKLGKGESVCFQVDSEDKTYLIRDYLVTHNTTCAAMEVSYHATGLYPEDWKGHRLRHPKLILCGTNTNETTRDICQNELFGDPADPDAFGTGSIPKHLIKDITRKAGVPNAFDSVTVQHSSGRTVTIRFRAYEQGKEKHMGIRPDFGWMDEEPPQEIFSQYLRGTIATNGKLLITFTPENGITQLVYELMNDPKPGTALIQATWDDAPHLTEERKALLLSQMAPFEREMRSKGIPTMGSGLVFAVTDDDIKIAPFEIPNHWPRIMGIDLGWDHPFAIACLAIDTENNKTYLYETFKKEKMRIADCGMAMKKRGGDWMPIAWPHDGMQHDKSSGKPFRDIYEYDYELAMLPHPFSNPPQPGKDEGTGGQGVEVGLHAMLQAMEEGRFKVFETCTEFFDEKSLYHRKVDPQGKVTLSKIRDDVISATRYAFQSARFADIKHHYSDAYAQPQGMSNWH